MVHLSQIVDEYVVYNVSFTVQSSPQESLGINHSDPTRPVSRCHCVEKWENGVQPGILPEPVRSPL
jgi:hypothetical protein